MDDHNDLHDDVRSIGGWLYADLILALLLVLLAGSAAYLKSVRNGDDLMDLVATAQRIPEIAATQRSIATALVRTATALAPTQSPRADTASMQARLPTSTPGPRTLSVDKIEIIIDVGSLSVASSAAEKAEFRQRLLTQLSQHNLSESSEIGMVMAFGGAMIRDEYGELISNENAGYATAARVNRLLPDVIPTMFVAGQTVFENLFSPKLSNQSVRLWIYPYTEMTR